MMAGKGAQTRQRIIEESLHLFTVRGYFNTSISDILEATGLTKGGLYGHFQSKEDIWYAVYERAVEIWQGIVFEEARGIANPVHRIEKTIENDLEEYMGRDVFEGGCFFFNSLVELSGQSGAMCRHILRGFVRFSRLIHSWLEEADQKGLLKEGLNLREVADFIVIGLNGAGALYSANRDPSILKQTINQLSFYVDQLKK
jgi:AcrR family transcriptional regulator